jgi:hypothetical protein
MIEQIGDNEVYISVDTRSFFAKATKVKEIPKPSPVLTRRYMSGRPWMPWSDDNLYPVTLQNLLNKSPEAEVCLDILNSYTYGNGLGVFDTSEVNGKKAKIPVYDAKQQAWLRQINAFDYCVKAITDYWQLGNFFPQFIPSLDRKTIANVRIFDAPFVRLQRWGEETCGINNAYISGAWHTLPIDQYITVVPFTDKWNAAEAIATSSTPRFMYQGYRYTPGEQFYHRQPWHAMVDNGTMDIAGKLPSIRKRMIDNSMFIKYHVEIEQDYWAIMYGAKWPSDPKEQRVLKMAFYEEIEKKLTGSANAFKSVFSEKTTDVRTGNTRNLISIKKIETDAGKDAAFWSDIMASTAQIFVGMAVPPPLVGPVLSDAKSQGGGSDIAESQNALISRLKIHRANILEPLDFAMRYSGLLSPTQTLEFEDTLLTTLDVNPTGQQKVVT